MTTNPDYLRDTRRKFLTYLLISILVFILIFIISLTIGPGMSIKEIFNIVKDGTIGNFSRAILNYRLVRIILGTLVGFTLSYSGATLQNMLQNPLADPYILGISAGAGFGASLTIVLNLSGGYLGFTITTILSFLFALGTIVIVYLFAKRKGQLSVSSLVITGIIISSFLSAGVVFLLAIAPLRDQHQVLLWLLGDISGPQVHLSHLIVISLLTLSVFFILLLRSKELDILSMGEEDALHLGMKVERTKIITFALVSLATAGVVSISGLIGFVGIIVPHGVRSVIGNRSRHLLPVSAVLGAVVIIVADTLSRISTSYLPLPVIPVGVITALFGAPYFLYIFTRRGRL
jgi:iron complex transport system permease protein